MTDIKKIADCVLTLRRTYDKLNKLSMKCKSPTTATIIAEIAGQVLELLVKLSDTYVELLKK